MKANELPEKVYVHKSQYWGLMANEKNITKNGIEYVRKDLVGSMLQMSSYPSKRDIKKEIFIEKACEWMSSHLQMQYDGFSSFIKDFRKAMKRE